MDLSHTCSQHGGAGLVYMRDSGYFIVLVSVDLYCVANIVQLIGHIF